MTSLRKLTILGLLILLFLVLLLIIGNYIIALFLLLLLVIISAKWYSLLSEEIIVYYILKNGKEINSGILINVFGKKSIKVIERLSNKNVVEKKGDIIKLINDNYKFSIMKKDKKITF